ncbi:glucose-6-phosphate exchanger SLC37A2 isoform X2 [Folsomia candida]|uniref:glucose-6-phosphate exchanger SLC37A2 isoform X2 n=1 Tax=Folsomia candida TaxID=158441 RepID=UPI000B8F1888|nr:glucose-6-phosphate exchanger SLC37A2 isoform X2 [Folsomia candida]
MMQRPVATIPPSRAGAESPGGSSSSSSSSSSTSSHHRNNGGGLLALGNDSNQTSTRSRSPSIIVRTGGSVHRHRRRDLPWGIRIIQKVSDWWFPNLRVNRDTWYRVSVLVLTYISYTSYHMSRKPISIVKNVLNHNCSAGEVPVSNTTASCGWAPFDRDDADVLLGTLDSAFLFAYAAGMFVSGFIAERVNLRYFLSLGMILSGFFTYLFGLAYSRNIHNLSYFILVQALGGVLQTTGWPGVVTVVGNWFGKGKRGLIFGLWNSHTSLGNILGSLIAGSFLETNWGLSFIVPGAVIGVAGFLIFLLLVPKPQHVHCSLPDHHESVSSDMSNDDSSDFPSTSTSIRAARKRNGRYNYTGDYDNSESCSRLLDEDDITCGGDAREDTPMIPQYDPDVKVKAVGFTEALKIPGVVEFSLCLFFAKLVSYTFLYWLPRYINNSTNFSPTESGNLSTLFDVGGIIGGVIAGVISDYSGMSATTCAGMLTVAIPMMLVYETYGTESLFMNIMLLILVGILVNGPYALITTAVSTELGTHPCLMGNARALATVTAIIDGTGSIGAAVGPLLAGPVASISKEHGWKYVFLMLMVADVIALILLVRLVSHEFRRYFETRHANQLKMIDGRFGRKTKLAVV